MNRESAFAPLPTTNSLGCGLRESLNSYSLYSHFFHCCAIFSTHLYVPSNSVSHIILLSILLFIPMSIYNSRIDFAVVSLALVPYNGNKPDTKRARERGNEAPKGSKIINDKRN